MDQKLLQRIEKHRKIGGTAGKVSRLEKIVAELVVVTIQSNQAIAVAAVTIQFLPLQVIADALVGDAVDQVGDPDVAAQGKTNLDGLTNPFFQNFEVGGLANGQQNIFKMLLRAHVFDLLIYLPTQDGITQNFGQKKPFEHGVEYDQFKRDDL